MQRASDNSYKLSNTIHFRHSNSITALYIKMTKSYYKVIKNLKIYITNTVLHL